MNDIIVRGMHGLGDNLHQRALLRQLMMRGRVWLESSWMAPYYDLVGQGLRVVHKTTSLRTQAKNAKREAGIFCQDRPPAGAKEVVVWYRPDEVKRHGSVLGAMCANTGCDYDKSDFRLPVPEAWQDKARSFIGSPSKPIMVYRPLVERTEWKGCAARNPDHDAYLDLFLSIRDRFHVVSVADLVPGVEWIAGHRIAADQKFHGGELDFEAMAGMFSLASLVFCSPGFAVILAQAVETPVVSIFGGYERAYSFSAGARYSPYLGIEPINPTDNFSHDLRCDKRIDIDGARERIAAFVAASSPAVAA